MAIAQVFNRYYVCGKTDCGQCRAHNEDTILINGDGGIVLLADGMGGHQYGDRASAEATQLINQLLERYLPPAPNKPVQTGFWQKIIGLLNRAGSSDPYQALETDGQIIADSLIETNQTIYRYNQDAQMADGNGMGTTLVGCKFSDTSANMHVFHLGDSRLYRWRNQTLTQLTKDHSAYQNWLDNGRIGEAPGSNVIYQGIGPKPEVKPDIQIIAIEANDSFLLCSDGLTDLVEDDLIADILKNLCRENIEEKTQELIDIANQNGGTDNISVILISQ